MGGRWQESGSEWPIQARRVSREQHRPWGGQNVARVSRDEGPSDWGPVCPDEGFCLMPRTPGSHGTA